MGAILPRLTAGKTTELCGAKTLERERHSWGLRLCIFLTDRKVVLSSVLVDSTAFIVKNGLRMDGTRLEIIKSPGR